MRLFFCIGANVKSLVGSILLSFSGSFAFKNNYCNFFYYINNDNINYYLAVCDEEVDARLCAAFARRRVWSIISSNNNGIFVNNCYHLL